MVATIDPPIFFPSETTAHGLSLLLSAIITEIHAVGTGAQASGFFVAVGKRIAGYTDVSEASSIEGLAARINRFWVAICWGHVQLEMREDAILIHHSGMPKSLDGDVAEHWPNMGAALLEGAYDTWLRTLGSGPKLQTKVLGWHNGVVELRHGV